MSPTKAEQNAYSRGYAAGQKRKKREVSAQQVRRKQDAFWLRAFLALLPAAFSAQGWERGGEPILMLPDRIRLAKEAADEAMKFAPGRFL